MKTESIIMNGLRPLQPPSWAVGGDNTLRPNDKSFADYMKQALGKVEQMQTEAGELSQKMAAGETADIHQTMIAYEKATLALQLTIEVRNKLVEAYQEIMRIQM